MIKRKLSKLFKFLFLDVVIDMMIFLVVFAYSLSHRGHGFHHIAGLIVALVGLGFRILSRIHLGDSFSVKSEAKKLVTSGMYSKIRNPIYIFSLLAFTGVIRSL
jgi:protein-S-isoprenylcysteine O-methyltransferase Ste14